VPIVHITVAYKQDLLGLLNTWRHALGLLAVVSVEVFSGVVKFALACCVIASFFIATVISLHYVNLNAYIA